MTPVTVYTTLVCPYCVAAKQLLKSVGASFTEIRVDQDAELRQRLAAENGGWQTVPMIFAGDRFLGGFRELADLHRRGELAPLLETGRDI